MNILRYISKKLAQFNHSKSYKTILIQEIFVMIIFLFLLIFIKISLGLNSINQQIVILIIFALFCFIAATCYNNSCLYILNDYCNLSTWENCFNKNNWIKKRTKLGRLKISISKSQIEFFRGNFNKAIKELETIEIDFLRTNPKYELLYHYYLTLSLLMTKQSFNFNKTIDKINSLDLKQKEIKKISDYLKAVRDIMVLKKENDFFEKNITNTKFQQLQCDFFQSNNLLISNQKDLAMEIFKRISKENIDLFIVKRSKEYI